VDRQRWQQLEEIFQAALELSPEARATFLDQACDGNQSLRQEAARLLSSFEESTDFIESPAFSSFIAQSTSIGDSQTGPLSEGYRDPLEWQAGVAVGRTIEQYDVLSLLGAGGMGEVYLAHDRNLDRKVALKLLPAHFTKNPELVRRFGAEARSASSLNHPNIITIHEIGQVEETYFIATEFIEGETLRQKMRRGAVSLNEVLEIAIQITRALSAAHEAGIVHRDIKPENVMIRPDGLVKVLDFGLAKLATAIEHGQDSTPSHTPSGPQTDFRLLMGTPGYLSPEQVRAEPIDHRTDIFSLGIVLFELVARRRPFVGGSAASTLDAILTEEPDPLADLAIPAELDTIIWRTLRKDREQRYQTAADLRCDLEDIRVGLERAPSNNGHGSERHPGWSTSIRRAWQIGVALLLFSILAVGMWFAMRPPAVPGRTAPNWVNAQNRQFTDRRDSEFFPSFAPDGESLVYSGRTAGNWDLYWQPLGSRKPVNLTNSPETESQPAYSPDGRLIAFSRTPGGIYIMEADGRNPQKLTNEGYGPSWSPDGKELVVSDTSAVNPDARPIGPSGLWIVDLNTRTRRRLTGGDAVQPKWSPHGHRIAFWLTHRGGERDVATISVEGGEPVLVTNDEDTDWNPVWSPDGEYLYWASDRGGSMNFWRVGINEKTGEVLGEPEPVLTPSRYSRHLDFSRDGKRMAYVQTERESNVQRVDFDPATERLKGDPVWVTQGGKELYSPQRFGEKYLVRAQNRNQEDLFIIGGDGATSLQLTNDKFKERQPLISPDGLRASFDSGRSGRWEIWIINTDGTGLQQVTMSSSPAGQDVFCGVWSPDSTRLVVGQTRGAPFIIDLKRGMNEQVPEALPKLEIATGDFMPWSWSPDGASIAGWIRSGAARESGIFIYSLATRSYRRVSPIGQEPVWLSDSRRLLFTAEGPERQGTGYLLDTKTMQVKLLLPAPPHLSITGIGISRDDRSIYYSVLSTESDVWISSFD
jgi:eukaryotic-like serine/threonine-protein kinase